MAKRYSNFGMFILRTHCWVHPRTYFSVLTNCENSVRVVIYLTHVIMCEVYPPQGGISRALSKHYSPCHGSADVHVFIQCHCYHPETSASQPASLIWNPTCCSHSPKPLPFPSQSGRQHTVHQMYCIYIYM